MTKVLFNKDNIDKCVCSSCPVQTKSACVKKKMERTMAKMMDPAAADPASGEIVFDPKEVPVAYCAAGKAACDDLDTSQMCICGTCPVWAECDLEHGNPLGYFCRDGAAE
jgi:hypothetical protein